MYFKDNFMKLTCKTHEKLIKFLIHNVQGLSFGSAQKCMRNGDVKVNGKRTKQNIDVYPSDEIDVFVKNTSMPSVQIIYEDENILIVNKPCGLECATRDKSSSNTYSLEEIFASKNATIVHRLDRLTEGLIILSKNLDTTKLLEKALENREIHKTYMALVEGTFENVGTKVAYLKKDALKSKVEISATPCDEFKEIITEFKVIKTYPKYTLLEIKLHTGRTHQIRAHLSYLKSPIVNDSKYGKKSPELKYPGYFLTSAKLDFDITGSLSYLNNLHFEIEPTWEKLIENKD